MWEMTAMQIPSRSKKVVLNRGIISESGVIPPGFQYIRDVWNFNPIEKPKYIISEDITGKKIQVMQVSGLFQEADLQNANGRIYPRPILANAVRAIQEDIGRRAVYGELDHPCISTKHFRVLTIDGWKWFSDVKVGETVYSRVNGQMVPSRVNAIVDKPFNGTVYRFKGRHIDTAFTGDHKVVMDSRNDGGMVRSQEQATVNDIIADRKRFNKRIIPRTAGWSGDDFRTYTIPGIPADELPHGPNYHKNDVTKDLVLDTKLFVSFLGIWLAEGSLVSNYGIYIHQNDGGKADDIAEMLAAFPTGLEWRRTKKQFYLSDARLHRYLSALGTKYTKYVPADVKTLAGHYLEELVHWFQVGDGRSKHGRNNVFSVSQRLVDDLHECHVKAGGCCYEMAIEPKANYQFAGHTIVATRKKVLHQLTLSQTAGIHLDDRFLEITPERHDGRVYCLVTEHGSFYMQHGGFSFWTGNCDAKIHLDRISHLVTKSWMDQNKVYGQAEILDNQPHGACLRGLFERKCQVGISSRGVGDMETKEIAEGRQVQYVCEGYMFVTWDAVAEPSVHGATLTVLEGLRRKAQPIVEAKAKNLLRKEEYEHLLVTTIHDFFETKPLNELKKPLARKTFSR